MIIWLVASIIGLACIYGIAQYSPVSGNIPSLAEVVIYNGFNRLGWSCAVSWVIIACIKTKGGPVNEFLAWNGFIPLARISYVMYLIHMTILSWHNSVLRDSLSYGTEVFIFFVLENILLTAALSAVLVITFEMPILHMEKLCFALLGVGGMPKAKRCKKTEEKESKKIALN